MVQTGITYKKQANDHHKAIRNAIKAEMKNSGNVFFEVLDKKVKQAVRLYR